MSIAMPAVDEQPQARNWTPNWTQPNGSHVGHNGRFRDPAVEEVDRNVAIALHLTPLLGFFFLPAVFTPLVIWLIRKDHSAFCDDHGKEVVNFLIGFVVIQILLILGCLTIVGIPIAIVGIPAVWIVGLVSVIRGAVAASRGEYFRYPMTIRFIS